MSENKSQLLSIGEVSKSLGITRRIILNYEAKGLLTPDKKDGASGNRYYTADSLARIRTIRILQNLGLSLDDINAYYNGTTDLNPLIQRLEKLRDKLNVNIEKLKERTKEENDYKVNTTTLPTQTIFRKTLRTSTIEERTEHLRELFINSIRNYGSDTSKPMFFIEYPIDDPDLVSYCIAIPPESAGEHIYTMPEEEALCVFYHGSYESLPTARDIILAFAKDNNISTKNICRHIYLEGPPQHKEPEKYITQVAVLIDK